MSFTTTKVDEQEFKEHIVQQYTDIIGEKLGGKVLAFSDEWFAAAENLIKPKEPIRDATRFTYAGAWYDGWETRRHNTEECDWVIFEMGVSSATLIGCEVDTAFFNGNHAPFISVEGANLVSAEGSIDFKSVKWDTIINKMECGPSQKQYFVRDKITEKTYTHIKLNMFPDGGIARFRLYGKVNPIIPNNITIQLDTASAVQGGVCTSFSDQHFGSVDNLLLPGRGHDMSDGWETKRSRGEGHVDWVIIKLGHKTNVKKIVVDTAHFRGNFPQYIKVEGIEYKDSASEPSFEDATWETVVSQSKTGPDKEHEYEISSNKPFTHVKLIMIPDGGIKRLRCWGTLA
ncbi:Allantoicase [Pichia californica]|uniref:allantoicase n=1 Tax=Pichia californica TaxID=460514 RepID=A0A9P6WRL2_9ASCO|nr:Allantoicase [[Candida] californica]KAG0691103.1 Allantoicase [[Candida] californica]